MTRQGAQTLGAASALALAAAVSLCTARFAYALLLPPMRADLGWSYFTAGAMNTVNAAGYLLGALALPRLLRRVDARPVMLLGGVAAALLMALHSAGRSEAWLLVCRASCGIASAARAGEREETRAAASRFAGLIRAALLCATIAAYAPIAAADPYEAAPDLATRDEDYAEGKRAAEKKDWAGAARYFQRAEIRHPDHADLQDILGSSYRNLKQFGLAFKHYRRAIELDPRHRGAHEYIGETYLLTGDLAGAQKHLAAFKEIGLLPCDELKDLERAVAQYRDKK